jgi:hypothetical protein
VTGSSGGGGDGGETACGGAIGMLAAVVEALLQATGGVDLAGDRIRPRADAGVPGLRSSRFRITRRAVRFILLWNP